jgi:soluble lytic murein transglycosylase-like protein
MRFLRVAMLLAVLTASAFAAEIAELRNGFLIVHRSRESRDGLVRLYLDDHRKSFVDVPEAEIASYSNEPDPPAASSAAPVKTTGQIVAEASAEHGVDSDFIRSVIRQESAGNASAVSRTGARGLMQLMPGTAEKLGVKDSFSPEQNVQGGAQYLRELLERYDGDATKALAAYNAGPAAVDKYKGIPPYRETRQYVSRVVHDYNRSKAGAPKAKGGKKSAAAPAAERAAGGPKHAAKAIE